jgi:hypothetical protein
LFPLLLSAWISQLFLPATFVPALETNIRSYFHVRREGIPLLDVTLCTVVNITSVSEEPAFSIFRMFGEDVVMNSCSTACDTVCWTELFLYENSRLRHWPYNEEKFFRHGFSCSPFFRSFCLSSVGSSIFFATSSSHNAQISFRT